jgi:hypothetical protein
MSSPRRSVEKFQAGDSHKKTAVYYARSQRSFVMTLEAVFDIRPLVRQQRFTDPS